MTDTERTGRNARPHPPTAPVDLTKRSQPPDCPTDMMVNLRKPRPSLPPVLPRVALTKPTAAPHPSPPTVPSARWSAPQPAPNSSRTWAGTVIAAIAFLAAVVVAVTTYALTRSDSDATAGSSATDQADRVGGHGKAIPPCATPPSVSVQSVSMTNTGLSVTANLSSSCSEGDVLTDPRLRLAISNGGDAVAAGEFDTRSEPVVIRAGETATRHFVFISGSYWQTPETLDAQGSGLTAVATYSSTPSSPAGSVADGTAL